MKTRNYINCSNAAEATDKIILNGDFVTYFGDTESASDFLNRNSEYNFHYEWMQREYNFNTDSYTRNWVTIEIGDTRNIRAFAQSFGL